METENRPTSATTLAICAILVLSAVILSAPSSQAQDPPLMKLSVTVIGNATADGTALFFDPDEILIGTAGILVNVTFVNLDFVTESRHNFTTTIDGVFYETPLLDPGEVGYVEFWINNTGTFEYWCSVPGHRQLGMEGKFIVGLTPPEDEVRAPMELSIEIYGEGTPDGFLLRPDRILIASVPILVKVTFINNDTVNPDIDHNFKVDIGGVEYETPFILPGQVTSVEFWINETGVYGYWCDVPGHREAGMEGVFVVGLEEAGGPRGIALRAYWIGLIGIFSMIAVIIVSYFAIKYESRHHADHKEHKRRGLP